MKQQLLEARIFNAIAALGSAKAALDRDDKKHAEAFLVRGIELLKGAKDAGSV